MAENLRVCEFIQWPSLQRYHFNSSADNSSKDNSATDNFDRQLMEKSFVLCCSIAKLVNHSPTHQYRCLGAYIPMPSNAWLTCQALALCMAPWYITAGFVLWYQRGSWADATSAHVWRAKASVMTCMPSSGRVLGCLCARVRGGRVYCVVSCVSVLITFKYCIMICDWLSNDKWLLSVMILRVFTNLCSSLLCHDIADMWCVWAHWHMLWILSRC